MSHGNSEGRCFAMTSSRRIFGDHGSTSPATRLMTIKKKPPTSSHMRGRTSAQTSGQTATSRFSDFFFLISSATNSLDAEMIRTPGCYCFLQLILGEFFVECTSGQGGKLSVAGE